MVRMGDAISVNHREYSTHIDPQGAHVSSLSKPTLIGKVLVGLSLFGLASCSFHRPFTSPADVKEAFDRKATVQSPIGEQSTIELDTDWAREDAFLVRQLEPQGELPSVKISGISVTEAGLYDVMQLLFANTGLSLTFEGGTEASKRYGAVTASNLNGSLHDVVSQLAESIGFFWSVRGGRQVLIQPEQQFVVDLPPVLGDDNLAGITNTMQFLGARDVYLDRINRSLVFRTNRRALASIESYLGKMRESRSMLVYEMQVLQVDLADSSQMGVQWKSFTGVSGGDLNSASTVPGVPTGSTANKGTSIASDSGLQSLNTFIYGPRFSMNVLINFLRSQGDVKTISQPRIGLMSGTKGLLRVGQSIKFVSKVGSVTFTGPLQTTVETSDLRTGLEISLAGEEHDKTVYTRINLSISELLRFNKFTALQQDLNLPEVADRELKTQVRSRPGDTIVLGGITVTRTEQLRQQGSAVNAKNEDLKQSELVIAIRPRVVRFGHKKSAKLLEPVSVVKEAVLSQAQISTEPVQIPPPVSPIDSTRISPLFDQPVMAEALPPPVTEAGDGGSPFQQAVRWLKQRFQWGGLEDSGVNP